MSSTPPLSVRDTLPFGAAASLGTGDLVDGVYEVQRLLGRGAMGEVWEGYDRVLRRRVALKVSTLGGGGEALKREAEALAAVRHPSVPTVYHVVTRGGLPCVVMERLYGISLEQHLRHRREAGERFGLGESLDVLIALADVLAAVHAAGIAHRDVKPANLWLGPRNRLILLDLGIFAAECFAHRDLAGTPLYMAPEAVRGQVDPGAAHLIDIYAFGVVAFELLAGETPFAGETVPEVLLAQLNQAPPDLASRREGLPPELPALVAQLLAKKPQERPQSIEPVLWQLRALRSRGQPASASRALQVLIVDDDPDSAALMRAQVERAGVRAQIESVGDADGALRSVRQNPPDLILLDLELPGMNGIELCMYLRGTRLAERCSIVSVSGTGGERDLHLLSQLGVTEYIVKGPELTRRIAEAVRRVRQMMP